MSQRVVITGMGICSPLGNELQCFAQNLANGESGIQFFEELKKLNFSCQIGGKPDVAAVDLNQYFTNVELRSISATGLQYGTIAGLDAWCDAGLGSNDSVAWDAGVVFGTGVLGVDPFRAAIYKLDEGNVRRLGSSVVQQTMASGISAFLGGKIGAGNWVTTNSSACSTGTEALLMGFQHIRSEKARTMLVGSCSDGGPYVWGGFDSMRILPRKYNSEPQLASRPMSATASGFVPSSGAGALVLESLESALARGARIYAEVLGGALNSGGQRNGGSMTAPNNNAVQYCISQALSNANVKAETIDAINGHLTATTKDSAEIENWTKALGRSGNDFPFINSFKGALGHGLAASGSMECVATVLQLYTQQLYGNRNCEDVHPQIAELIETKCIPQRTEEKAINIIAKASFGFGDVNACVIFKSYQENNR